MGAFIKRIKSLFERLTGCEIVLYGGRSFAFIDKKRWKDAWLSNHAQIRSIIEKYKINIVIDVCANKGQFARELRSFYPGEILSFEPVSSVFEKLAAAARSDQNWHVYNLALGSEESTQTLNVADSTDFSSLLKANDYCAQRFGCMALGAKEEVVSVCRLDQVLDKIAFNIEGKRIFLKLDTQGYDTEVFKGLGNILEQTIALQSEVSLVPIYENMPHWTETISTYERAGFGVVSSCQ